MQRELPALLTMLHLFEHTGVGDSIRVWNAQGRPDIEPVRVLDDDSASQMLVSSPPPTLIDVLFEAESEVETLEDLPLLINSADESSAHGFTSTMLKAPVLVSRQVLRGNVNPEHVIVVQEHIADASTHVMLVQVYIADASTQIRSAQGYVVDASTAVDSPFVSSDVETSTHMFMINTQWS